MSLHTNAGSSKCILGTMSVSPHFGFTLSPLSTFSSFLQQWERISGQYLASVCKRKSYRPRTMRNLPLQAPSLLSLPLLATLSSQQKSLTPYFLPCTVNTPCSCCCIHSTFNYLNAEDPFPRTVHITHCYPLSYPLRVVHRPGQCGSGVMSIDP